MQVPFFKTGLENNEYCIWITSVQTTVEDAILALKDKMPGVDKYFERGSIEILNRPDWFMLNDQFALDDALQFIYGRLGMAVEHGYAGLRINGDDTWRDRQLWQDFMEFERALTPAIAGKKLIVACSWQLTKCTATDVLDVGLLHESVVSKRKDKWEILETPQLIETKAQLNLEKELLEKQVAKGTRELNRITEQVKKERSERKKAVRSLHKSQLHLKTIVDTADVAFVLFDSDSHVLLFNAIASYWSTLSFGVPLMKDIYFPELLHENGKSRFSEMMKSALSGQSLSYETSYQDRGDSPEWYRVSIQPAIDDDGKAVGVICAASNITQDRLAESEHERLSGQLVQRNKDLEKFAFILSHDLRAPLANMLGLAKMLKDTQCPDSEKSELEGFLYHSIEKLNDVVHNLNRILELDKSPSLKKEHVDLTELVNEVSAQFKPIIKQNAIRIVTDFNRANNINSVRAYLHNIFYNLISNSIIYGQPGKPPVIEITSEREKDRLIIYFKSFGKTNYRKSKETEPGSYKKINLSDKSNGIALYGVKSKIELLGGSISVRTLAGSGIAFRMELPLEPPAAEPL
ncbi:MAG TPA: MEDS domain-containing protein, partial [Mucilaginibacter sp.]|nr:MEDS domain-containing protein [Mucilaginibacter sp.]